MYVCMYVCTYVRTYVRTYVCTYVCLYVCMSVCLYVCVCVRALLCLSIINVGKTKKCTIPHHNFHCVVVLPFSVMGTYHWIEVGSTHWTGNTETMEATSVDLSRKFQQTPSQNEAFINFEPHPTFIICQKNAKSGKRIWIFLRPVLTRKKQKTPPAQAVDDVFGAKDGLQVQPSPSFAVQVFNGKNNTPWWWLTVCYWKWPFIADWAQKKKWFSIII